MDDSDGQAMPQTTLLLQDSVQSVLIPVGNLHFGETNVHFQRDLCG